LISFLCTIEFIHAMDQKDYKGIVTKRYLEEAQQKERSLKSTMPDLNTRRLEIENILKYLNDNESCLEIGCGNGAASVEISKLKNLDLVSTDTNEEMIKLAKKQPINEIRGKIQFLKLDVLNLDYKEAFDIVFSIRCIINLMLWDDQKTALQKIAKAVKRGGKLILLEAFSDGLEELNQARKEFKLNSIPPAYHNLHLNKDLVISHLQENELNLIKEDNFLSSYYFGSRVLYPAIAKANNVEMVKNSKIDKFFSYFVPIGNFSHIKILAFRKNN